MTVLMTAGRSRNSMMRSMCIMCCGMRTIKHGRFPILPEKPQR